MTDHLKPSAQRTLARLRAANGGWVGSVALSMPDAGGLRFGGRLMEIRQAGYVIEKRPIPHRSTWEYRLVEAGPVQLELIV